MLTSTALVLFMTIPGLALFYGGMVRSKNILSVMMQCFAITGLISILWVIYGYSMAFDTTGMEKASSTSTPSLAASPRRSSRCHARA
jgi:Amt family ammonium transporter